MEVGAFEVQGCRNEVAEDEAEESPVESDDVLDVYVEQTDQYSQGHNQYEKDGLGLADVLGARLLLVDQMK